MSYVDRKSRVRNQYYIDRRGHCHRYKGSLSDIDDIPSIHTAIAYSLFPDKEYADDYLMSMGWVLMGSVVYYHPIIHMKPSPKQIKKLCKLNMIDFLYILYKGKYITYDEYILNYE